MSYELINISLLFFSFFHLYKFSVPVSVFVLFLTIMLHLGIIKLYHSYFCELFESLEKERENIFMHSISTVILPKETISNYNCEICYDSFPENDEICELKCNCKDKYYHEDCILHWFKKNNSCPFCRKAFQF